MQRSSDLKFCKTHNQEKGQYYVANEPWNKLCKKCALNRAVCGYKIQKDLSPQQFQNKIILTSLVKQLKNSIQLCEKNGDLYSSFSEKLNNEIVAYVNPILKNIDDHLKQLTEMKSRFIQTYDVQILQKINKCHQIKSRYFMDSMSFKKHLQNLQTNYCDIIMNTKNDNGEQQQFCRQVQLIKSQIQNNRKLKDLQQNLLDETLLEKLKEQFNIKSQQFELKAHSFKNSFQQQRMLNKELRKLDQSNLSVNKLNSMQQRLGQKPCFSHRKNAPSLTLQQNRAPSLAPSSQLSYRPMNLTLKNSKRNNSISIRGKNVKQDTLNLNHLKF